MKDCEPIIKINCGSVAYYGFKERLPGLLELPGSYADFECEC